MTSCMLRPHKKKRFRMRVLDKLLVGVLTVYTEGHINVRICLHENHVNKDDMKRSRTVLVFTLTSSIISERNMIDILFLQKSSLVNMFRRMQA